jgi:hypothetical protein
LQCKAYFIPARVSKRALLVSIKLGKRNRWFEAPAIDWDEWPLSATLVVDVPSQTLFASAGVAQYQDRQF